MIKTVVNEIEKVVEGLNSPIYLFEYTTFQEASNKLQALKYTKSALLITWVDGSLETKGNGIFIDYDFVICFCKRQAFQKNTDTLLDDEEELEVDLMNFVKNMKVNEKVVFTENKMQTKKYTNYTDENLIIYSMPFSCHLLEGETLNLNCD